MNPVQGLDSGTDYWFHNQRREAGEDLRRVMEIADALGSFLALAALALAITGLLLYLGFVAVVLGEGLKLLVGRQRPSDAEALLGPQMSPSFPNVSALLTSMLLLILVMIWSTIIQGRLRFLIYSACLVLVLLIGASQLYLGLHFLTDLLAGWTAGVLLALVWYRWAACASRLRNPR